MKDPYVFDLIELKEDAQEKDLEVPGEDYYIDLLFYNIKLKCYVVIELKAGKFKPEYVYKLSFLKILKKYKKVIVYKQ